MNNVVTISNLTASAAVELKFELENSGLILNHDFTWTYHPVKYDNNQHVSSYVDFDFATPTLASFYRIKWAK